MFKRKREQPAQPQPQAPAPQVWEPQPLPEGQPLTVADVPWSDAWLTADDRRAWR